MESPAFPDKLMKLYKMVNISMSPKILQKRSKLDVFADAGNIWKTPFSILIAAKSEMHQ